MLCILVTVSSKQIIVTLPRLADQNSHRLLHLGKTAEMWNEVLRLYQQERPGLVLGVGREAGTLKQNGAPLHQV